MAGYVKIETWSDLMRFENHVTIKLADCGYMPYDQAVKLHEKYHVAQDERLAKEFR